MRESFYRYIQTLQDAICEALEREERGSTFREDPWERPGGGGGRTRILSEGQIFEKAGVSTSAVHGVLPESMREKFQVREARFYACGLSLVVHPRNPFVPTTHANWRYFELYDPDGNTVDRWFGGGLDLTPYYLFEEDARHFHSVCKASCDQFHPDFYPRYKKCCDAYFWLPHRGEARGVGGLFFDYLRAGEEASIADRYAFITGVGNRFLESYLPIVQRRRDASYTQAQRDWQEVRRGRYVEYNLIYDRGTLFGLRTQGRTESILMSLPPHAQWRYDYPVESGSQEEKLLEVLKNPRDWVG